MNDLTNNARDPFRAYEVAAGIYAADKIAGHMRTVEQQNEAILESQMQIRLAMWREHYRAEGWTEDEIDEHYEDLMEEERQENEAARAADMSGFNPLIGFGLACAGFFVLYLVLTALGY